MSYHFAKCSIFMGLVDPETFAIYDQPVMLTYVVLLVRLQLDNAKLLKCLYEVIYINYLYVLTSTAVHQEEQICVLSQ